MPASILLAILLGLSASTRAQDPCVTGNHAILNDPKGQRSSNFAIKSGVQAICDFNLAPNWYRVDSPAGALMPTACVQQFNCSTKLPVWLNGDYPTAAEREVNRTACYNNGSDCCHNPFTIQVLNCIDFVLFYLHNTSTCDSAYCFGDRTPCPDGFWSVDGFEPGCELITTTESPSTNLPESSTNLPESSTNTAATLPVSRSLVIPLLIPNLWLLRSNR